MISEDTGVGKYRNKGMKRAGHMQIVGWSVHLPGHARYLITAVCSAFSSNSIFIFLGEELYILCAYVWEGCLSASTLSQTTGQRSCVSVVKQLERPECTHLVWVCMLACDY